MPADIQTIPARHGIATFVPKDHHIKIINTYGTQVVDTWAFALHKPPQDEPEAEQRADEEAVEQVQEDVEEQERKQPAKKEEPAKKPSDTNTDTDAAPRKEQALAHDEPEPASKDATEESTKEQQTDEKPDTGRSDKNTVKTATGKAGTKSTKAWSSYVPSLRSRSKPPPAEGSKDAAGDGEKKGEEGMADYAATEGSKNKSSEDEGGYQQEEGDADRKSTKSTKSWGSYIPSIRSRGKPTQAQNATEESKDGAPKTEGWLSYIPSGTSFTSYLPSNSKEYMSAFAASHHRDPTKSYAKQLYEFSKTPVGAASISAATGSGTAGSLYAAYNAYTKLQASQRSTEPMEYLSLSHTFATTFHLSPQPGDTLVTNLRNPLLTVLDDTTPPAASSDTGCTSLRHGTILPACDPATYKEMAGDGEKGEEHGSCAENLVLALQELNKSAGLKGAKSVGCDVTINSVPTPLSLFMNVTADPGTGGVVVKEPRLYEGGKKGKSGEKGGWVRFKAEMDVVVVMSACPMESGPVNGGRCMAANFVVEEPPPTEQEKEEQAEETKDLPQKKESGGETEKPESGQRPTEGQAKAQKKTDVESEAKGTEDVSGVQTPKSDTSAVSKEATRNAAKPGRKKPKKLEKRS